jgi:hypothetical protein
MNFNVCCPCPVATAREIIDTDECIEEIVRGIMPDRPRGCPAPPAGECTPETLEACVPCGIDPSGSECAEAACVSHYDGECHPCCELGAPCPEGATCCPTGSYCIIGADGTYCEERDLCNTDEDCSAGWECRNHLEMDPPLKFCWHPESQCCCTDAGVQDASRDHVLCDYHHFCEDPDADGIYTCEDHTPDCRVLFADMECELGEECDDAAAPPDGDGRGACR